MPAEIEPAASEFAGLFERAYFRGDQAALEELLSKYDSTFRHLIRLHLHPRVRCITGSSDCLAMFWEEVFVFRRRDWRTVKPESLLAYFREMVRNLVRNLNERHLGVAKRSLFRESHFSEMPNDWNANI